MKKFLLICLFLFGLGFVLFNFKGLATTGNYDSIVLDFREDIPAQEIQQELEAIAQTYNTTPQLNSEFSSADNIFILPGNQEVLRALQKSNLRKDTEYIEPNYIYQAFEVPNDPLYSKKVKVTE